MADIKDAVEKTKTLIAAPSCYVGLKVKAQEWLDAVGTGNEYKAAVEFINEVEADILQIDQLIELAESAGNKELAAHAKDVKAKGGKYCDCEACTIAAAIIEIKDVILCNSPTAKIIAGLQAIVTGLSQQADGHFIQSKIFAAQGLNKLAKQYAEHADEERGYVGKCIDRIIDLGGDVKNEAKLETPICKDAVEYLKHDLKVSKDGLAWLLGIIKDAQCDLTTFDLLKEYFKDEEHDMYWTEQQLELIEIIGIQNWFATQI